MSDRKQDLDDPQLFRPLERMLFLSDAVFAIVLTLLVLELHATPDVTDANLFRSGIVAMMPKLVAFVTSFFLVSVFWIAHVSIARRLTTFDWAAAWVNLIFLFTIALTPFVSGLLGAYSVLGNAWRIYCLALIAIGTAQLVLFLVIYRGNGRLVGGVTGREFRHRLVRASSPAVGFSVVLMISLLGWPRTSFVASWGVIPALLIAASIVFGERKRKSATLAALNPSPPTVNPVAPT
jgi:uncharacterized membrane protein